MLYLTFTFQIEMDDGSVTSTKMFCQNKDLRNLIRCPTYISSSLDYCNVFSLVPLNVFQCVLNSVARLKKAKYNDEQFDLHVI